MRYSESPGSVPHPGDSEYLIPGLGGVVCPTCASLARFDKMPTTPSPDPGSSLMLRISKRGAAVHPSATLAAGAKARQLRAGGKTVFDFSRGEPDLNTPRHICEAAYQAMLKGQTHYTP